MARETRVNAAAAQFGVPPSTLRDRLSGQVVHGTRPGVVSRASPSHSCEGLARETSPGVQ